MKSSTLPKNIVVNGTAAELTYWLDHHQVTGYRVQPLEHGQEELIARAQDGAVFCIVAGDVQSFERLVWHVLRDRPPRYHHG